MWITNWVDIRAMESMWAGGYSPSSPAGVANHAKGMAELLRLRGPGQFRTGKGQHLFWVIFTTIVSLC
jgi:hypothetical protein